MESNVSFMYRKPKNAETKRRDAVTRLGSAYGYRARNAELPKRMGYWRTGSARLPPSRVSTCTRQKAEMGVGGWGSYAPPRTGPRILPALHTKGMTLKARAWWALSTTISATIVRITPTFPFNSPADVLAIKACVNVVENPNARVAATVPNNPHNTIGLRPYKSDNRPHGRPSVSHGHGTEGRGSGPEKNWAKEKLEASSPAYRPIFFSSSERWKSRIIKNKYGKLLVIATGSEKRQAARMRSCRLG
jgi:hypothetical protein